MVVKHTTNLMLISTFSTWTDVYVEYSDSNIIVITLISSLYLSHSHDVLGKRENDASYTFAIIL